LVQGKCRRKETLGEISRAAKDQTAASISSIDSNAVGKSMNPMEGLPHCQTCFAQRANIELVPVV
jgi:hypothetical protein